MRPFPALRDFAVSLDLAPLDSQEHGHVPYVVLLIKALEAWKSEHEGNVPKTQADKDAFRDKIKAAARNYNMEENFNEAVKNAHKCFKDEMEEMKDGLREVIEDPKIADSGEKGSFWLLASALAKFVEKEGTLPVSGKVPDMTSTTDFYITLQNIY